VISYIYLIHHEANREILGFRKDVLDPTKRTALGYARYYKKAAFVKSSKYQYMFVLYSCDNSNVERAM